MSEAWNAVSETLAAGGKVLWVSNQIKWAMERYQEAAARGLPTALFHSRYRYCDRLKQQRAVVDGFRNGQPPLLALTTQVAEMSLDLSADLLISDYAPVPAMIQRLGRLNRFEETPTGIAEALFIEPESELPYSPADWWGVHAWLARLSTGEVLSQRDLASAFLEVQQAGDKIRPAPRCEWVDGLDISLVQRPIEEPGYTIEVIREEDASSQYPEQMAIPMPGHPHKAHQEWQRQGRYYIAPSGTLTYDRRRGGTWNSK